MRRQSTECKDEAPPERAAPGPAPELPAWKAFVVQFSRETGTAAEVFSGRVEHLSSGLRARFNSRQELLAILERQLEDLRETPD